MGKYILQSKRTPKSAAAKKPTPKKEPKGAVVHDGGNALTRTVEKPGAPIRYGNF
jgi:hypothetical protein